jgi:hypothetical protein
VAEIVLSRDADWLEAEIGKAVSAMDMKFRQDMDTEADWKYVADPSDVEALRGDLDWIDLPGSSEGVPVEPELKEVVMETREEEVELEGVPVGIDAIPFGGEQSSQDDGVNDQEPQDAAASRVETTCEPIARISFSAPGPPET